MGGEACNTCHGGIHADWEKTRHTMKARKGQAEAVLKVMNAGEGWPKFKYGDAKNQADWQAIWPWEKGAFEKKGQTVAVGAAPWL